MKLLASGLLLVAALHADKALRLGSLEHAGIGALALFLGFAIAALSAVRT